MAECRKYSRNFTLKRETYDKLRVLADERGFGDISVFITKKMIISLYRRIDIDRLNSGKIAREPIPRKIIYRSGDPIVNVHIKLTETESKQFDDVIKYHNYIDKYGKPEYSKFLACWIVNKWGERDEELKTEEQPIKKAPNYRALAVGG